jgi:hypothetical protein
MNTRYEPMVPDGFFDDGNIPLVMGIFIVVLSIG